MKELKTNITPNPYFWIPDGSTSLTATLLEYKYTGECYYIKLLLKYPVAEFKNADLFQYFDQYSLRLLGLKKTILIFDATFEGFSPNEVPIAEALYENCLKYNIDPVRIFFFTGNLIHKNEKINVIPMFILAKQSNWANSQFITFNESKNQCEQNYQKPILSLSRRNRFHRVLAHCMLFNSSLMKPLSIHLLIILSSPPSPPEILSQVSRLYRASEMPSRTVRWGSACWVESMSSFKLLYLDKFEPAVL